MAAEIINLNDTTPAPSAGHQNVTWQRGPTSGTDPTYGLPVYPVSAQVPLPASNSDAETVSGSGTSWTLAHTPNPAASLILVQHIPNFGGVVLIAGTDYTISGASITTTNSLTTGVLTAWYRY